MLWHKISHKVKINNSVNSKDILKSYNLRPVEMLSLHLNEAIQNWQLRRADVRCPPEGGLIVGKEDSIGHAIDRLDGRMRGPAVEHLSGGFPFLRVLFGDFRLHSQEGSIVYGLHNTRNFQLKQEVQVRPHCRTDFQQNLVACLHLRTPKMLVQNSYVGHAMADVQENSKR
ncbi:unnamed protein product [Rodentolepis nana]|uniref:Uncharacterized protein n=1 Tax=Rodentolepis nana TaxID=102285 RepID=A0A0R3TNR9_RODNA|nr:unnamed protein product [Rodentolepis nana]